MRVLLASYFYPPSVGGVERQSQLLARGLALRGHSVRVIAARVAGSSSVEHDGGIVIRRVAPGSGSRWTRMATYIAGMAAATLQVRREIDVIHVQQALYPAAAMASVSSLLKLPMVVTNHGSGPTGAIQLMSGLPFGACALRLIRSHSTCVAVSREALGELLDAGFERVLEIPNGVLIGAELRDQQRAAARTALGHDGHVAVYIGRLDVEKNVELLIRAWQETSRPARTLVIVGDGPVRAELEHLARSDPHTASTIRFCGTVADVQPSLSASDVFVLPSRSEGMPIALLEAMAAGVPVIATDVGGTHEILERGDVGMLVPSDDVAALAEALVTVEQNPKAAREMANRAREHIARHYSAEVMVSAYERLYESMLMDKSS